MAEQHDETAVPMLHPVVVPVIGAMSVMSMKQWGTFGE